MLFYGIVGLVVYAALYWLNKTAKTRIHPDKTGETTLRMNKLYFILGSLVSIMWIVFVAFLSTSASNDWTIFILLILIVSIVSIGPGIPCILWYLNHKVTFDNDRIHVSDIYGKMKTVLFRDIVSMNTNIFTGMLELKTQNDSVKIHQHLVGVKNLIERIKDSLA